MCKRSDGDLLIRTLTDRYKLNILRLPRRGVGVGELLIREGKDLRCVGSVKRFFDPVLDIPNIESAALPDVDGISSARLSANFATAPLIGLLTVLGVTGASSISASLHKARNVSVAFNLTGTQYRKTDLVTLGDELSSRVLREDNALYRPGREFFIAYATAEALGLKVAFSSGGEMAAGLALELAEMIKADAHIDVAGDQSGHLVIVSPEPIVFGIAVVQLKMDDNMFRFDAIDRLRAVRGEAPRWESPDSQPYIFFGGSNGDALVEID